MPRDDIHVHAPLVIPFAIWLAVLALIAATWAAGSNPWIANHRSIIVVWVCVLAYLAGTRLDRMADAGLRLPRPVDLVAAIAVAVLVLTPYALVFLAAAHLWTGATPDWSAVRGLDAGGLFLAQLAGAALPEELFYRGYLQPALDARLGKPWRVLGAELGWGLVIASALFALPHLFFQPPIMLSTFFPGLLFGWLRARTGAIWAPVLVHAVSNVELAYLLRIAGLSS